MTSITFFKQISPAGRPAGNRNQNIKPRYALMPKLQVGPATLGIITIVIILLMSLLYLVQANSTATKGYEIEKQQDRIKTLSSQAEKLELEMARLRSTKELDGLPEKLNLKPLPEGEVASVQFVDKAAVAGISLETEGLKPKR